MPGKSPLYSARGARIRSNGPAAVTAALAAIVAFGLCGLHSGCADSRNRIWDTRRFTSPDREPALLETADAIMVAPAEALESLDRALEDAVY